ncbi:hypothetical protein PGTUg99_011845 [Puccinia graminis f. sp. tritici]|uniref:Uncharacterized protein n=1 Tax=Puccinia graminis f. sp. tritici TaxID=56615 RepID=A0A5B0QGB7_PUCGR|nr:hypothetical protein PGTUg99_011845 [Puccinia graminis f. sp. tritici]
MAYPHSSTQLDAGILSSGNEISTSGPDIILRPLCSMVPNPTTASLAEQGLPEILNWKIIPAERVISQPHGVRSGRSLTVTPPAAPATGGQEVVIFALCMREAGFTTQ